MTHIISDTFRRDNLEIYGGKGYSPALNAFAEKCVVFDKAYVCSYPTVPTRGDLVTGEVGICRRGWEPLKSNVPVIANALTKAGVVSMMIADTPHHLNNGFLYNQGFTGWKWIRGQETDILETHPYNYESDLALRYREHTRPHPNKMPAGLTNHLRNADFRRNKGDTFVAQTMQTACDWLERNYQHELENQGPPKHLFHLPSDPEQMKNRFELDTDEARRLYQAFLEFLGQHGGPEAMVEQFQNRWKI